MFSVQANRSNRRLDIKMSGLIQPNEIEQLRLAAFMAITTSGFAPGRFDVLLDISELPIQPMEIHQALCRLGADASLLPARRAIYGTAGSRMQARRGGEECETQFFDTRWQALRWLHGSTELALSAA